MFTAFMPIIFFCFSAFYVFYGSGLSMLTDFTVFGGIYCIVFVIYPYEASFDIFLWLYFSAFGPFLNDASGNYFLFTDFSVFVDFSVFNIWVFLIIISLFFLPFYPSFFICVS